MNVVQSVAQAYSISLTGVWLGTRAYGWLAHQPAASDPDVLWASVGAAALYLALRTGLARWRKAGKP